MNHLRVVYAKSGASQEPQLYLLGRWPLILKFLITIPPCLIFMRTQKSGMTNFYFRNCSCISLYECR